jgi:fatty acid desaturase
MKKEDRWRPRMSWGTYTIGVVGCTLIAASIIFIAWPVLRSAILLLIGGSALIFISSVMHVWRLMRK